MLTQPFNRSTTTSCASQAIVEGAPAVCSSAGAVRKWIPGARNGVGTGVDIGFVGLGFELSPELTLEKLFKALFG